MDLKVVDLLEIEKNKQLSDIETLRSGIRYWKSVCDGYDAQLEGLIKEFNNVIRRRKNASENLAEGQSQHRKAVDRLEKINKAIKALEDLED